MLRQTTVRGLYRSLYRELSSQHAEMAKAQAVKDEAKQKALKAYRERTGTGQDESQSQQPGKISRLGFSSHALRNIFEKGTATEESIAYGKETLEFLKHQNIYKVLLDRYNPGANMGQEERVRLSANKVGLSLPEEMNRRIY